MAKVSAVKEKLNGWVLGVRFKDGQAVTESPVALAYFRGSSRFTVTENTPAKSEGDASTDVVKAPEKPAGK